ncbi:MAG: hypothetical protein WBG50_01340 [Desulfomonilaceae bacterium]
MKTSSAEGGLLSGVGCKTRVIAWDFHPGDFAIIYRFDVEFLVAQSR